MSHILVASLVICIFSLALSSCALSSFLCAEILTISESHSNELLLGRSTVTASSLFSVPTIERIIGRCFVMFHFENHALWMRHYFQVLLCSSESHLLFCSLFLLITILPSAEPTRTETSSKFYDHDQLIPTAKGNW